MKTGQFLARVFGSIIVLVVLAFVAGYSLKPETDVGNLGLYNLMSLPTYIGYTLIRIIVGGLVALLYSIVTLRALGVASFEEFRILMRMPHNDSHIILVRGFVLSGMILAAFTPGTDFVAYIINVAFRGGAATFIATLFTVVAAQLLGEITSLSELRHWVDIDDNDSFAEMTSTIFTGVMIAAVLVR